MNAVPIERWGAIEKSTQLSQRDVGLPITGLGSPRPRRSHRLKDCASPAFTESKADAHWVVQAPQRSATGAEP